MEGNKINSENLPPWEMHDDGLINTSGLANAKAMIYTFVEAALAHNDRILVELLEKDTVETEQFPAPTPDPQLPPVTKHTVNQLIAGSFNAFGIQRWWNRKRAGFGWLTPEQMWEIDPQKVYDLAKTYPNQIFTEGKEDS